MIESGEFFPGPREDPYSVMELNQKPRNVLPVPVESDTNRIPSLKGADGVSFVVSCGERRCTGHCPYVPVVNQGGGKSIAFLVVACVTVRKN